jgi:hypothetical protein
MILKHIMQENLDMLGVQETIKQDFSDKELREMAGSVEFLWKWILARGHSGGFF